MCGRFVLASRPNRIQERFRLTRAPPSDLNPSYNIAPGSYSPVITNEFPQEVKFFQFGLTPHWASKPMYLFNARSEGDFNKENDPSYAGKKGIVDKPAFRQAIRSQRCLVPADAFIEGKTQEKLDKPYLVFLKNRIRPFAFAGIWDRWQNPNSGEWLFSFAIITTVANDLLGQIPHHRSPVILHPRDEKAWLDNIPLNEVLDRLRPFPAGQMNAYPIDARIKNPRQNDRDLLEPQGENLQLD